MMVRSTTSALTTAAALAALFVGGASATASQPDQGPSCADATAVAANAQVALDARTAELPNLRAALDLALGANEDDIENTPEQDQAIVDAQAALAAGSGAVADLTASLDAALNVRAEACTPDDADPGNTPAPTTPAPPDTDADTDDGSDAGGGSTDLGAEGFDQTDADEVPVGAADTGGL